MPTIWIGLDSLLQEEKFDMSSLRLAIGAGSALPRQLIETFQKQHGIELRQLWGMTETTPVGTVSTLKCDLRQSRGRRMLSHARQAGSAGCRGWIFARWTIRATKFRGTASTMGEVQVRGPWVISAYYNDERSASAFMDGWFRTGDVANIDRKATCN